VFWVQLRCHLGCVFGTQLIAKSFVISDSEAIAKWDSLGCGGFALKGKILSLDGIDLLLFNIDDGNDYSLNGAKSPLDRLPESGYDALRGYPELHPYLDLATNPA
jgi:hypothetical protein